MASTRIFGAVRRFSTTVATQGKLVRPPVQLFGVDGRYANALYSAASKEKKLEVVEKELASVQGLMQKDPQFAEFIANPSIKRTFKTDTIETILKKQNLSSITVNFFAAMSENGRLASIRSIINSFNTIMAAHRGEVICVVTTAKPLDTKEAKELDTALRSFLQKGESLLLETNVDPSLIGGMRVTIGDKYVDMSMSSKIKTYTNLLRETV